MIPVGYVARPLWSTFIDTLSADLSYNKNDVIVSFYKDAACTDLITTWSEADGKFRVSYATTSAKESVMTIEMTDSGLTEINTADTVYSGASMVNSGYSDCTVRITYAAIINDTGDLRNNRQTHLEHHLLTASATVDGNAVNMLADNSSVNASVPLKVVNTRRFYLPQTGDNGTWMFSVIGILLMAGSAAGLCFGMRKKNADHQ